MEFWHGDADLRDIIWNEKRQQAFWIDFGFNSVAEKKDSIWKRAARNEYNKIEAALSARVGN